MTTRNVDDIWSYPFFFGHRQNNGFNAIEFSLVDIYAYHVMGYATMALNAVYGWDIGKEVPGMAEILGRINARPLCQQVDAAQAAALAAMQAAKG